jgi:hypothetical protein
MMKMVALNRMTIRVGIVAVIFVGSKNRAIDGTGDDTGRGVEKRNY